MDPIKASVECVPGALRARSSVRGVNLIVYLHLALKLRFCGAIPPFSTYTPSWRAQQEIFLVVVYVDTCSSNFNVGVLCEVKKKGSRGDYVRPFVSPSVLLFCGLV